jgi:hypothetical protein
MAEVRETRGAILAGSEVRIGKEELVLGSEDILRHIRDNIRSEIPKFPKPLVDIQLS